MTSLTKLTNLLSDVGAWSMRFFAVMPKRSWWAVFPYNKSMPRAIFHDLKEAQEFAACLCLRTRILQIDLSRKDINRL